MASGDTKTQEYLNLAATGTRADLPAARGCCNTRTQNLIVDVADRIITEEETRAREDAVLQGEIDEIKNNPDVADIVATYADLQNYDTSHLTDKDIIRVLADETHDGASTYYRWSTSSETFTYIGETGDYYTKSQVNDLLDDKQDLLTAGDGITIEDESGALVISATDTTYSNFTGTDGTAAGTAGLVPAPATTDAGKFLKADGTWDTAGGSYTAGDGIDITSNVISATNTGKAKVLTTDDYDYPDGSPDGVALWKLDGGLYTTNGGVKLYYNTTTTRTPTAGTTYLLIKSPSSNIHTVSIISQNSSTDVPHVYVTSTTSGSSIIDNKSLGGPTVVQATGTSQTSVMSQKATTSMVYPVNGDKQKIAIGQNANVYTNYSQNIAIGTSADAAADFTTAIGNNTKANHDSSVAIGDSAQTSVAGEMNIGAGTSGRGYNSSNYRLLTGLYDPQSAHDAATKSYVDPTTDSSAPTTATVGRLGQIQIDTTNADAYMCVAVDSVTPSYSWKKITA